MAKQKRRSSRQARLDETLTDLVVEALKEFAPGSAQRLIDSGIELMEAHREFLAERIARLERVRGRITAPARRPARRDVPVRTQRPSRARKTSAG